MLKMLAAAWGAADFAGATIGTVDSGVEDAADADVFVVDGEVDEVDEVLVPSAVFGDVVPDALGDDVVVAASVVVAGTAATVAGSVSVSLSHT